MPCSVPEPDHQSCAQIRPVILPQPAIRPDGRITVKFVLRYGLGALWGVFASSYPPPSLMIGWGVGLVVRYGSDITARTGGFPACC